MPHTVHALSTPAVHSSHCCQGSLSVAQAHLVAKFRRAELILEQQRAKARRDPPPRWLHVLKPSEREDDDLLKLEEVAFSEEIDSIRAQLERLKESSRLARV